MNTKLTLVAAMLAAATMAGAASAATLVDDSTLALYNDGLGRSLDGTNPFGGNTMFPVADHGAGDPVLDIPAGTPPDLSAAAGALGNWLGNTATPGGAWSAGPVSIPGSGAINSETAIIYQIEAGLGGITNALASFGADNGVFVWLNGVFMGGQVHPGGVTPGEFTVALGTLTGTNFLQVLREDHGGSAGYTVSVTGDVQPAPVPLPASALLLAGGLAGLGALRRRARV